MQEDSTCSQRRCSPALSACIQQEALAVQTTARNNTATPTDVRISPLLVYRIMWLISCLLHQCKSDAIIWHRYTTNKLFHINNRDVITQTFEPLFSRQVNSRRSRQKCMFFCNLLSIQMSFLLYHAASIKPLQKSSTLNVDVRHLCKSERKQEIYIPWTLQLHCPVGYDIILLHHQQKFKSPKWLKNTNYISMRCRFCLLLPFFFMTLRIL